MIKKIKWSSLLIVLGLAVSACGGGVGTDIAVADMVSTAAAQTAEFVLTETAVAGGSLSSPTPLPLATETPVPAPTEDAAAVPTNALAVETVTEDTSGDATTEGGTTPVVVVPTATDAPSAGGSSSGCEWSAVYNSEDPPYDGSQFKVSRTGIEKTWYVTNSTRDASGNGCAWSRTGFYLRWVGSYRSDKKVDWQNMSQADKAALKYVNDFGANITEFIEDNSVPYLTKVPITVTLKMPKDPGYYMIEWLIYGHGDPVFVSGGALWIELKVFSPDG